MGKVQKQENREITQKRELGEKTKSFWSQMPHLKKYSLRHINTVLGRLKKKMRQQAKPTKTFSGDKCVVVHLMYHNLMLGLMRTCLPAEDRAQNHHSQFGKNIPSLDSSSWKGHKTRAGHCWKASESLRQHHCFARMYCQAAVDGAGEGTE